MEHIVSIRNLRKKYPGFELGVPELALRPGVVTGLIGPNGAGKTTMIKCLLNLVRYEADQISILGNDNLSEGKAARAGVGFMFDDKSFFEDLSVVDVERLVSGFYSGWDAAAFRKYLEIFSIGPGKKVKELSKGMRASLFSAVALSHNARLVILDEPTAGLDPGSKQKMLDLFEEYVRGGARSIFFSTHSTTDLDKIASDIVHIERGSIMFSGAKPELIASFAVVADRDGASGKLVESKARFVAVRGANSSRLVMRRKDFDILRKAGDAGFELLETNIEDIMLYAAGEHPNA